MALPITKGAGASPGFHNKFKLIVEHASFLKCAGYSVEIVSVQYIWGCSIIPSKRLDHVTLIDAHYKRNLDPMAQDRDGSMVRRWSVSHA